MRLHSALLHHAEAALAELLSFKNPADSVLSRYFRAHPKLGHADRGFIAENAFAVLRHLRTLSARAGEPATPRRLLLAALCWHAGYSLSALTAQPKLLTPEELAWLKAAKSLPADAATAQGLDLPDWLFERLGAAFGDGRARLAAALNRAAPLDLRINPLKTSRDAVLASLAADGIAASASAWSPLAVTLASKPALARHPLFLSGAVEVQDAGSQLLGFLLAPRRGEMVADFCAGAGGKTLLLGALMRSTGRLYAFDVAEKRLARLKPRLARSGLSNVHPLCLASEKDARLKRFAGKFDRVFVDAPCSGIGTLRRNPDLKWRQTPASIAALNVEQAAILAAAARLVKPGGRLVYATCSLLPEENAAICRAFLAAQPDFAALDSWEILGGQGISLPDDREYDRLPGASAADAADPIARAALTLRPDVHGCDGFFALAMERG